MTNLKYLGFLFLLPLVIGAPVAEKDSSETNIKLSGGAGSYAYIHRGCEGEVTSKENAPFKDAGFSIDHKFKGPVKIGLRSGYIFEKQLWYDHCFPAPTSKHRKNIYVNPHFAFEGESFGIGFGPFFAQKSLWGSEQQEWGKNLPSAHIRIGNRKLYFSANLLENVPLYSGGGYVNFGLGFRRNVSFWWIGLGGGLPLSGPYDAWGLVAKSNLRLNSNWHLDLAGRLGVSEGVSESAISIGLNYRL